MNFYVKKKSLCNLILPGSGVREYHCSLIVCLWPILLRTFLRPFCFVLFFEVVGFLTNKFFLRFKFYHSLKYHKMTGNGVGKDVLYQNSTSSTVRSTIKGGNSVSLVLSIQDVTRVDRPPRDFLTRDISDWT